MMQSITKLPFECFSKSNEPDTAFGLMETVFSDRRAIYPLTIPVKELKQKFQAISESNKKGLYLRLFGIKAYADLLKKSDHLNVLKRFSATLNEKTQGIYCGSLPPFRILNCQIFELLHSPNCFKNDSNLMRRQEANQLAENLSSQFSLLFLIIELTKTIEKEEWINRGFTQLKEMEKLFEKCKVLMIPQAYSAIETIFNLCKIGYSDPETYFPFFLVPLSIPKNRYFLMGLNEKERSLFASLVHHFDILSKRFIETHVEDKKCIKEKYQEHSTKVHGTSKNLLELIELYYRQMQRGSFIEFFNCLENIAKSLTPILDQLQTIESSPAHFETFVASESRPPSQHEIARKKEYFSLVSAIHLIAEEFARTIEKILITSISIKEDLQSVLSPELMMIQSNCISPKDLFYRSLNDHILAFYNNFPKEDWMSKASPYLNRCLLEFNQKFAHVSALLEETPQGSTILETSYESFSFYSIAKNIRELNKIIPPEHPYRVHLNALKKIIGVLGKIENVKGSYEFFFKPVGGNAHSLFDKEEKKFLMNLCEDTRLKLTQNFHFFSLNVSNMIVEQDEWKEEKNRFLHDAERLKNENKAFQQKLNALPPIHEKNFESVSLQMMNLLKVYLLRIDQLLMMDERVAQIDSLNLNEQFFFAKVNDIKVRFEETILYPLKPLFKYLNQVTLLHSDVQGKNKTKRNKRRKAKEAAKKTPTKPTPVAQPQVKYQSIRRKEDTPLSSSIHPEHSEWKTSSVVEKIIWIECFCHHIPNLFFDTVPSNRNQPEAGLHLTSFKQEAALTLRGVMEELKELEITQEDLTSPPAYLSSLNLLLATSIEQSLKLILLCRDIPVSEQVLKSHETSPLLNLLTQAKEEKVSDLVNLDESQMRFIHALQYVIPITSRYHGSIFDELTNKIAELNGSHITPSSLSLDTQIWAHQQVSTGLDIIALMLNSLDLEHKIQPREIEEEPFKMVLDTIKPIDKELNLTTDLPSLFNAIHTEIKSITSTHLRLVHCPIMPLGSEISNQRSRRKLMITHNLGNLSEAINHLEKLLSNQKAQLSCVNYAKACYLHESVALEQTLLILLSHLPIASSLNPAEHLLYENHGNRMMKNSHLIYLFLNRLHTYFSVIKEKKICKILKNISPRSTTLTLYLKKNYRYRTHNADPVKGFGEALTTFRAFSKIRQHIFMGSVQEHEQPLLDEINLEVLFNQYLQKEITLPITHTLQTILELIRYYRQIIETN